MDISIVICTSNRCESLLQTMQSIFNMNVPKKIAWEIIVVDNNSKDNTKKAVEELILNNVADIKYFFEKKKGLSCARNRGIKESSGKIIAFTDDDCIVDQNWLRCILNEFHSDSKLSGIGGRVELFDLRDKPITIMISRDRAVFHSVEQLFSFLHGCNMAFDREVFQTIGFFDEKLGAGTKILSGEDSDLIYRLYKGGFKITYCPDVFVYHNHGRREDAQVDALMRGYLIGRGAFYCKHILKIDLMILKMAYWEISALFRNIIYRTQEQRVLHNSKKGIYGILVGAMAYFFISCKAGIFEMFKVRNNEGFN